MQRTIAQLAKTAIKVIDELRTCILWYFLLYFLEVWYFLLWWCDRIVIPLCLKKEDYPRLPLFTRKGPAGSTILLNPVFWLMLDERSTWTSMSQLYCNSDNMADLAISVYPTSSAALGGACPALSPMPKISRNLVAYLAGFQILPIAPVKIIHKSRISETLSLMKFSI